MAACSLAKSSKNSTSVPRVVVLAASDSRLYFQPPVRFGYGGAEHIHADEYFLVPFDGARMEWVSTSHGRTPLGKRPVGGGREANGAPLLHAIAELPNYRVRTVGKAGEHLGGAHFPFAGAEIFVEYYEVL